MRRRARIQRRVATAVIAAAAVSLIGGTLLGGSPVPVFAANPAPQCHQLNSRLESTVTATAPVLTVEGVVQSGLLKGSTAFTATFIGAGPTTSTLAYAGDFAITTKDGVLRTEGSGTFVPAPASPFSQFDVVDPIASTGRFANATGTLFFYGYSKGTNDGFIADLRGEVCLDR